MLINFYILHHIMLLDLKYYAISQIYYISLYCNHKMLLYFNILLHCYIIKLNILLLLYTNLK